MRSKNPGGDFGSRLETVDVVDEQAKSIHEMATRANPLRT
jgi:hypothetical protein